jgi:hypothetical protein
MSGKNLGSEHIPFVLSVAKRSRSMNVRNPNELQLGMSSSHISIASLLDEAEIKLTAYDVANPRLEAEVLLAHALGIERSRLLARLREPLGCG